MERVSTQPWSEFFSVLQLSGNIFVDVDQNADVIIHMNTHPKILDKQKVAEKRPLNILIMWESQVTRPKDFIPKCLQRYDYIFSPSLLWVKGENVHYFNWPNGIVQATKKMSYPTRPRQNKVVMIAANKFSFMKSELYSLRRLYLKRNSEIIDVYGEGWDSNLYVIKALSKSLLRYFLSSSKSLPSLKLNLFVKPRNYLGVALDKSILSEYKYSLVMENEASYVSEKLFDALVYGCIPIYVGPNLEELGIPQNVAFKIESKSTEALDLKSLIGLNQAELELIGHNGQEFILSKRVEEFENTHVLREMAVKIQRIIQAECKYYVSTL